MNLTKPLIILLIILATGLYFWPKPKSNPIPMPTTTPTTTPQATPSSSISYTATLQTDKGEIIIKLNDNQTPKTVQNFVTLAQKGFYDNTIFHRIINGFMIQGGDPKGDGTGGPDYKFNDEPFTGEYNRGVIAMANSGPNTNGSQFFIMHANYSLPKNYVIFGQVIKGLEVVDAIATAPVKASLSGENSQPIKPTVIKTITITEN